MAKRYQPPRDFSRNIKKPRLDISINKGRPLQDPITRRKTSCSPKDDFWDDGEDDVLLLATQVAETAASQRHVGTRFAITESELTFSEFAPNAGTSTQRPAQALIPNYDIISQMFDDDDDFDLLAATKDHKPLGNHVEEQSKAIVEEENVFKKPQLPTVAIKNTILESNKNDSKTKIPQTNTTNNEADLETLSQSAARRQLASERQIKFLMDRLDILKKENLKLLNEVDESKSKIVTKEGEASLLRDELKHIKHQMQNFKMEKILSTEAAKSESKSKIAELAKQVEAKKTELQLKSVECMQLKLQHAEVTQRFEISMRNDSIFMGDVLPQVTAPDSLKVSTKKIKRELMRLRSMPNKQYKNITNNLALHITCIPQPANHNILFKDSNEYFENIKGIMTNVLKKQWQTLRNTVAELQLASEQNCLNENEAKRCAAKIFSATTWTLHELSTLSDSLPVKNCRVYPYHDYDLQSDYSEKQRVSLMQPKALYEDEQALEMRRFVAALALLCRQYHFVARQMFEIVTEVCNIEGEYLLVAAAKKICRIGYSTELVQHFGLLESFATMVHSLLLYALSKNGQELTNEQQTQITHLLKELIFTRPNVWILRELSFCIQLCAKLPFILSLLCQNSASSAFRAEPVRSTCEFTKESCILQVYASLLEIAFPLHKPIRSTHFEILTVICLNHVRFVYHCFTKPPKFIHNQLPCYDEEDESVENNQPNASENFSAYQTNSSTTTTHGASCSSSSVQNLSSTVETPSATITCECYNRLCLSVVTLVYQVLRHWLRFDHNACTPQVSQISKICVQLLHIIFCDNYLTSLFRDAEDTTKHYLHLICKWWQDKQQKLQFTDIHINFLKKLQNAHIMPKNLKQEENIANLTADLADWCRITNDTIDSSAKNKNNLNLLESSIDTEVFFEGLKGYAFNFQ